MGWRCGQHLALGLHHRVQLTLTVEVNHWNVVLVGSAPPLHVWQRVVVNIVRRDFKLWCLFRAL